MTNLSTYSPNKIRRSNCLAYWRYTTLFYRVSIGVPLSTLETQSLDLQRMYKLLIRYASPMNIDTKLFRYSTTWLSNYDGNTSANVHYCFHSNFLLEFSKKNKNKKLKEKGKEKRKGKAVDLIISRLLAYIKFTQRRGRRGDRSIFRKAASIDKQIIGRDVIFRDGV